MQTTGSPAPRRIEFLDGHRGLAILLVVLYHAFARWPELVPYGDRYAQLPLFRHGWLGVQLFFLLSGFVILMTLEKCAGIADFLRRRWLRLFPAMLICSLIVIATAPLFPERPAGTPGWLHLLPGLTFVEPDWWSRVLRRPVHPLEEAFWSLFVEFKFYVIAAPIFFWRGRRFLVTALALMFALAVLARIAPALGIGAPARWLASITGHLSFQHFGWFAAGAAFYVYWKEGAGRWFAAAVALSIASALYVGATSLATPVAALLVAAVFAGSMVAEPLRRVLATRLLLVLGFVSYPLYLLHENIMVASIVKLGRLDTGLPGLLLPLLPVLGLVALAYVVAAWGEPALKRALSARIDRLRGAAPAAH